MQTMIQLIKKTTKKMINFRHLSKKSNLMIKQLILLSLAIMRRPEIRSKNYIKFNHSREIRDRVQDLEAVALSLQR